MNLKNSIIILNFKTKPRERSIPSNYDSKNGLSFKVQTILQLNLWSDITKFEDFSCEITFHNFLNQTKGIVYLRNCEFNEEFKRTLKEAYQFIENAFEASFIKSNNSNATAVLLTFILQ